jgi:hypothetical protein
MLVCNGSEKVGLLFTGKLSKKRSTWTTSLVPSPRCKPSCDAPTQDLRGFNTRWAISLRHFLNLEALTSQLELDLNFNRVVQSCRFLRGGCTASTALIKLDHHHAKMSKGPKETLHYGDVISLCFEDEETDVWGFLSNLG